MHPRTIACCLILSLGCVVIPRVSYAQNANDNASVTAQLNGAKPIVAKIKADAVKMESYGQNSGLSWQTHSATLGKIKDDVNELQQNMRGLQSHRTTASPWQQDAIDRITGYANDLATNMNAALDRLGIDRHGTYRAGWLLPAFQPDELAFSGIHSPVSGVHALAENIHRRPLWSGHRLVCLPIYGRIDGRDAAILYKKI